MAGIGFSTTNYIPRVSNGLGPRTLVVKLAGTNLTNAQLASVIGYCTTSHGSAGTGDSAFTVAGVGTADGSAFVSGETDTVYLTLQGTGTLTVADADMGISGLTVSIEAILDNTF